jgi:hypothetical protein
VDPILETLLPLVLGVEDRWRIIRIDALLNLLALCDLAFSLKCEEDFRVASSW